MKTDISKPEDQETPEDEAAESPEVQAQEEADGTEQHDTETGEEKGAEEGQDVKVPEQFQKEVETLIEGATSHQLEFMRSLIMDREKQLRKSESKSEKASVFDMEGMPE